MTPVFGLLSDFVAAAPAGDCPYDGELDDEFIVEGEGTALLSLTPFARVAGLAVPLLGAPVVPFDPGLTVAPLPADPPPALLPPPQILRRCHQALSPRRSRNRDH